MRTENIGERSGLRLKKFVVMEGIRTEIVEKEVRVEIEEVRSFGRDKDRHSGERG